MKNFLMLVFVLTAVVSCANNNEKKKTDKGEQETEEQVPSQYSDELTGYYSLEKDGAPLYKIDIQEILDDGMIIYTCTTYINGEPVKTEESIEDIYDRIKKRPELLNRFIGRLGLGFDKWLKHSLTVGKGTFLMQTEKGYNYKRDFSRYRNQGRPAPDDIDIISKTGYLLEDGYGKAHILYKVGDIEEKELKD